MTVRWSKAFYGWYAVVNGHQLSVRRYRSGTGWVYVSRVDQSAATSPAKAHSKSGDAMREAEQRAIQFTPVPK